MGHLPGKIADIVFDETFPNAEVDFLIDESGRYVRRRINLTAEAQRRHAVLNMAAWPDNPPLFDKTHGHPILSTAYLALITPVLGSLLAPEATRRSATGGRRDQIGAHVANVIRGLPRAMSFAARFVYARYFAATKLAGFFLVNPTRRYALHYFAEHAPNPDSRVTLCSKRDALGVPRLRIDLRYADIDARSVLNNHLVIDRWLRTTGLGRLEYRLPQEERHAYVMAEANDGYHHVGTTRMAGDPRRGVVDPDCRVHGTPNLFIASSSVFPTSGQANPTLVIGAFAARLAEHLGKSLRSMPETAAGKYAAA
jgi:choline dehydrogenase-like flavoprotein